MAETSSQDLKGIFVTGAIPSQVDFEDLIDSSVNKLDAGITYLEASSNKYFGIGTATPSERLEVAGGIKIGTAINAGNGTIRYAANVFEGRANGAWVSLISKWTLSGSHINYGAGNVGIGSGITSPTEKLEVDGAIKIGDATNSANGTIKFDGTDLFGRVGNEWKSLTVSGGVTSVNTRFGAVTLTKSDVGLGNVANIDLSNVNNTSDANKPVSTAQQTALDLKANQLLLSRSLFGSNIRFDTDCEYGDESTPITTTLIGLDITSALMGTTVMIIHSASAGDPMDPTMFKKLAGSGNYVNGAINYIFCNYRNSSLVIYTITQKL